MNDRVLPERFADELDGTPYRHVRALARGGMGEVHVVEHRVLGGECVMKVIRAHLLEEQESLTNRLIVEARSVRALKHRNLVEVRDFGFTNVGRAYLITELLLGATLKAEVRERGRFPLAEAIDVIEQTLAGLAVVHDAGLVHRDIKPDNLFYCSPGPTGARVLKVLDFGVAKILTAEARARAGPVVATEEGISVGTPLYMSPEQVLARPIDARADMYAVGAVLYHLVAGAPPFVRDNTAQLLEAHVTATPDSLGSRLPEVPAAFDAFVRRAMQKRPEDRFSSVAEMSAALAALPRRSLGATRGTIPMARTEPLPKQPVTRVRPPEPSYPPTAADEETVLQPSLLVAALEPPRVRAAEGPVSPARSVELEPKTRRLGSVAPRGYVPSNSDSGRPVGPTKGSRRWLWILLWVATAVLLALALAAMDRHLRGELLPISRESRYVVSGRGPARMNGEVEARGPRGTIPLVGARSGPSPEPLRAPVFDDEPTPLDPPAIDLESIAAAAAAEKPAARRDVADVPVAGDRFKDWIILGPLAEGGLSLVYEISHVQTRLKFALKILKPAFRGRDVLVKKQLAEGKLLMACRGNPYLCEVQDVGMTEAYGPYVVMELLTGKSLSELIRLLDAKNQRFKLETAVHFVIEIAEAVQTMHLLGVVHRDLKPDNIFVEPRTDPETGQPGRRIKLLDFATAKSHVSPKTSAEDATIATAAYVAPEIVMRGLVTGAVDQYALGVVLYEMLWQHPFARAAAESPHQAGLMAMWHCMSEIDAPPAHLVPAPLWAILQRALAKRADARFASMKSFAEALRAFLRGEWDLAASPAAQGVPFKPTIPATRVRARAEGAPREPTPSPPPGDVRSPKRAIALARASQQPTLLVLAPPQLRGQRFELGDEGVIGRHPAYADLVVDHPSVSNRHLRYVHVTGGPESPVFAIEDLESSNGTDVAGVPMHTGAVRGGELLGLGDVVACVVPAGIVEADLRGFTPLRDVLASTGATPAPTRVRAARRSLQLEQPWGGPSLFVLAPPALKGQRFDLGARGTLGRTEGAVDIQLADDSVSGAHASYTLVTSGAHSSEVVYLIQDLDSSNGTLVYSSESDAPTAISSAPVHAGQVLALGDVQAMIVPAGSLRRSAAGRVEHVPFEGRGVTMRAAGALAPMTPSGAGSASSAGTSRLSAVLVLVAAALTVLALGLALLHGLGVTP
jgi:serine/threonine-protein kinase